MTIEIQDVPTDAERGIADNFFTELVHKHKLDVQQIARVLTHLGSVLVLYAEQEDQMIRERAAAIEANVN